MKTQTKAKHLLLDDFQIFFTSAFNSEYETDYDFVWEVQDCLEENTEAQIIAENWDDEDTVAEFLENGYTRDDIIYENFEEIFESHDLLDEILYTKATELVGKHLKENDSHIIDVFVSNLKKIYFT